MVRWTRSSSVCSGGSSPSAMRRGTLWTNMPTSGARSAWSRSETEPPTTTSGTPAVRASSAAKAVSSALWTVVPAARARWRSASARPAGSSNARVPPRGGPVRAWSVGSGSTGGAPSSAAHQCSRRAASRAGSRRRRCHRAKSAYWTGSGGRASARPV
ncbi:MAG: hypothetical protein R3F59_32230 [Myxococcota bacterium]